MRHLLLTQVGSCGDVNEHVHKTISAIKNSGNRLLNLINDILDTASMAKVRRGPVEHQAGAS